jgi:hypothetical protein
MDLLLVVALMGVVGALAATFGADSRDGNDWVPHSRA